MEEGVKLANLTVAYVLIKTELGAALDVAQQVSALGDVHWAVVVTGPYDVIAGVRVSDNQALGELVLQQIQTISGVRDSLTAVMSSYHAGAEMRALGKNGPP